MRARDGILLYARAQIAKFVQLAQPEKSASNNQIWFSDVEILVFCLRIIIRAIIAVIKRENIVQMEPYTFTFFILGYHLI